MQKRLMLSLAVLVVFTILISGCVAINDATSIGEIGGADGPTSIILSDDKNNNTNLDYDILIKNAILNHNKGGYLSGECVAEGHIPLGIEASDSE